MTTPVPRTLVTGVGALIGQGIAHGLRVSGRAEVVGLDRRTSFFGDELCDETAVKPKVDENSETYLEFWADLVREKKIDLIIPGISVDMVFLNDRREFFDDLSVKLALNTPQLISLSQDKGAFAQEYRELGLPTIPSIQPTNWADAIEQLGTPPLLLKPCHGEGSVGIVRLFDKLDFDYWSQKTDGSFLIQQIVGSDAEEYTIGTFGLGDGDYIGPIILRRTLTRAGNTGEAETIRQPAIAAATEKIMRHFQPIGPTNLQFRLDGEKAFLLEINPRFSSSSSIRTGFGFNEAEMCLDFFLNNVRPAQPNLRYGMAQRHSADRFHYAGSDI